LILFNPQQIQDAMKNTSLDLNNTTNGYAMTFFHEIGHTKYGGSGQDPPFVSGQDPFNMPGRQEKLPNRIRRQLGSDYGKRYSYNSWPIKGIPGQNYFPWGSKSLEAAKSRKRSYTTIYYSSMGKEVKMKYSLLSLFFLAVSITCYSQYECEVYEEVIQ
jgi:hypothetical protein